MISLYVIIIIASVVPQPAPRSLAGPDCITAAHHSLHQRVLAGVGRGRRGHCQCSATQGKSVRYHWGLHHIAAREGGYQYWILL